MQPPKVYRNGERGRLQLAGGSTDGTVEIVGVRELC